FRDISWVARTGATARLVQAVLPVLSAYIEAGGKLDDLLVDPSLFTQRRTPFGNIMRTLGVERTWFRDGPPLSQDVRDAALELIDRIEERLRDR
ncbi:MAG: hypothetical protein JRG91_06755, partial [Deltaproteobacteria bacterium]|nr:hypothetical protein [Deltaproteobacteria bacterium]